MRIHPHPQLKHLVDRGSDWTATDCRRLRALLSQHHSLEIERLPTDLFAAGGQTSQTVGVNYHATWLRDTVHVAHAHLVCGREEVAEAVGRALVKYLARQTPRARAVIADPSLKADPMRRPHVRFDGLTLDELEEKWSHAQNDALGYTVWFVCQLILSRRLAADSETLVTLSLFVRYFAAIEYWHDEDSGHWEEVRKISASSIGCVVAALEAWRQVEFRHPLNLSDEQLRSLLEPGWTSLHNLLPAECLQDDPVKYREADAATLFLIYPLNLLDRAMADRVITRVSSRLQGGIGIKRYVGDSFYCRDYERRVAELNSRPTEDFSDDIARRDALFTPGTEAEWCLFDSTLATVFAHWYLTDSAGDDWERLMHHWNRALRQLTAANSMYGAEMQCPELYYEEGGQIRTSRVVPLLWSQANLWTAFTLVSRCVKHRAATLWHSFQKPLTTWPN